MPLIRYRTQDYGVAAEPAPSHGLQYPALERIEGRLQEFIVTNDGRLVSMGVLAAAHPAFARYAHEFQYYQDAPGRVEFRFVPREGYDPSCDTHIQDTLRQKLGEGVRIDVTPVPKVRKSHSGKHIMIVQKLALDEITGYAEWGPAGGAREAAPA